MIICIAVTAVAEITDYYDGWLARKYGKVTAFGKFYDPLCDAILHMSIFICLIKFGLSDVVVALMVARELTIYFIRENLALQGIELGARKSGKLKTVFYIIAEFIFMLYLLIVSLSGASSPLAVWAWDLVWSSIFVAFCFMLYSWCDYVLYFKLESLRHESQTGTS